MSIYEAAMINKMIHCQSIQKVNTNQIKMWLYVFCQGITPIWFVYAMVFIQLLQVVYTSVNFPIYWFVGEFRETFLKLFCCAQDVREVWKMLKLSLPLCEETYQI